MSLFPDLNDAVLVSMLDATDPLGSCSRHGFTLDGAQWPSVEHYVQGMQFEDLTVREAVRLVAHPIGARKLARRKRRQARSDWSRLQLLYMTRGVYSKMRSHPDVAAVLLATAPRPIVETSQYDYFWGCGRDTRGANHYGRVLVGVRDKLQEDPED